MGGHYVNYGPAWRAFCSKSSAVRVALIYGVQILPPLPMLRWTLTPRSVLDSVSQTLNILPMVGTPTNCACFTKSNDTPSK